MSKSTQPIFIFWGKAFEGLTAAIFVDELRRADLPVKMIGLNQRLAKG